MRRSTVIRLTLLPLLATATLANAQGAPGDTYAGPPGGLEERELSPPGLTPPTEPCVEGDNRDDCRRGGHSTGFVTVRGGFGGYFWSGGG